MFTDRVLVTLAVLRLQIPHAALAQMYGVHRCTVTRAVREVRPLLAGRGYATPQGRRLSTLADVFAYAAAHGVTLRIDGSEIQVRRPRRAGPAGGRSSPARRRASGYAVRGGGVITMAVEHGWPIPQRQAATGHRACSSVVVETWSGSLCLSGGWRTAPEPGQP